MRLTSLFATALLVATVSAASAQTFTFGKAKPEQQLATVESATSLETFTGKTSALSGKVTVDRKKKTVTGKMEIDATTVDTGMPLRNQHMQGDQWLQTAKFPKITFVIKSGKQIKGDEFQVVGDFTMRGVTKTLMVPVKAQYLPANAATQKAGFAGDVLHFDAKFPVTLSEYGIVISGPSTGKVSDVVQIRMTAFGTTK